MPLTLHTALFRTLLTRDTPTLPRVATIRVFLLPVQMRLALIVFNVQVRTAVLSNLLTSYLPPIPTTKLT